jgi:polysaccharide biosynthesis/export protein
MQILRKLHKPHKPGRPGIALLLLALFGVALGACAQPKLEPGAPVTEPEYRIAPPDLLTITVRPEPVITREVQVRPDGKISFDLIGEIDVYGKTVAEIRDDITTRIREFIVAPDVTVTLTASNSRRYYVFGEVGKPGAYPLEGEVRVIEAIAQAGGPNEYAALNSTRLSRPTAGEPLIYGVKLYDIMQLGKGDTNYTLQPGDVVYVPPNFSAQMGYAIGLVLFPFQSLIGLGTRAATAGR